MLDPKVIEQLIQDQVTRLVDEQALQVFASDEWLKPIEQKIIQYTQDRILAKFANATAMPEIVDAVKQGITELFVGGQIPGLTQFVEPDSISHAVDIAVKKIVQANVQELGQDPAWVERIEQLINQTVTYQTISKIGSMDIQTIINDRVDANMDTFREKLLSNFASIGISDQATKNQMTVMDEATVFENNLVARDIEIANGAVINNLVVKGSINTDNHSWSGLSADIAEKTLAKISSEFTDNLVTQVQEQIRTSGIDFARVTIDGELLVEGNRLSPTITQTNIQQLGTLNNLRVVGETHLSNTVNVISKRLGINTEEPEAALSIWDEEVSVNIGKNKLNQAYIGTGRAQGMALGTNRVAHLEITADGLTQIKKLQVGVHKFGHADQVPGWSGTKGDLVFNSSFGQDRVFAWVCLGAYKWQPLKSAE